MYTHLRRACQNVEEDIKAKKIEDVEITLGQKPPRIYAAFDIPILELEDAREQDTIEADEEHRTICLTLTDRVSQVSEIMQKHGLKQHKCNPNFKGDGCFVRAYGYSHEDYKLKWKHKY